MDPAKEQFTGIVPGIGLASFRDSDGVDRFLVLPGDDVKITLDVPADIRLGYLVIGHDSRLGQVMTNLIENARSFSPHGGSVRVAMRRGRNIGRSGQLEDGIELIVDDDGPGIPAHAFERIFERFYTDRPNQGFGQNSGLGLSISRQIAIAHGGHIWALNRRGAKDDEVAGARFIVWLPSATP